MVDALLLVAGSMLAFLASLFLQRVQRKTEIRSRIYLELLPALRSRALTYFETANQDPNGQVWFLSDSNWPYKHEADALFRHAKLAGRSDARRATAIRSKWIAFASRIDPEEGLTPSQAIIGVQSIVVATRAVLDAIDSYDRELGSDST